LAGRSGGPEEVLIGPVTSYLPFFYLLLVPFICFPYGSSFFILYSKGSCGGGGSPSSALLLLLLPLLRLLALLLSIVMELVFGCLFTSRSIVLTRTKNALRLRPAFPL
jgi:hypothetical protein